MVKVRQDLTGMIFGKLTVLKQVEDYIEPSGNHKARWLCECSCGDKDTCFVEVNGKDLKSGHTKSCGCYNVEMIAYRNSKLKSKPMCNDESLQLNLIDKYGAYGFCLTANTRRPFYFDMEDYEKIKDFCWSEIVYGKNYHCVRAYDKEHHRHIKMHQLIGCANYDHADKNPFNNRRYNLRVAAKSQNAYNSPVRSNNTSGVTGVHYNKKSDKWIASINANGKKKHLGSFSKKEDTIVARLNGEKEYCGEFAPQINLFKKYNIILGD